MEKVFKVMKNSGICNVVFGIIMLCIGLTTGIALLYTGVKLVEEKDNITF